MYIQCTGCNDCEITILAIFCAAAHKVLRSLGSGPSPPYVAAHVIHTYDCNYIESFMLTKINYTEVELERVWVSRLSLKVENTGLIPVHLCIMG